MLRSSKDAGVVISKVLAATGPAFLSGSNAGSTSRSEPKEKTEPDSPVRVPHNQQMYLNLRAASYYDVRSIRT